MNIPVPVSLLMVLTASVMWGSWFQFLRRTGSYPVPGFMLWLYSASFVIVWGAVLCLRDIFVPEGIWTAVQAAPGLCVFILVCGMLFSVSMQIQMMVVNKAGLVFATSVTAMFSIPYNFLITSYFGGIPETISLPLLLVGVGVIFLAGFLCQRSTLMRDADKVNQAVKMDRSRVKYMAMILVCVFVLGPSYTLAMSIGTRTELRPNGLPTILLVGILSTGSLIGTWIFSGIRLTLSHQWGETFSWKNRRYIFYACFSGFCHYGGNLIHTIGIPALSMSIAWPLGNLASFWQYLWGVAQGEYRDAKQKTRLVFGVGLCCYILALVILTIALYW